VGAAVSAGFLVVFVVIGAISDLATQWLLSNAKYATAVIGAAFVILGAAMLFGFRLKIITPTISVNQRSRTARSMFVYGVAYAVASLGCALPMFIGVLFGTTRRHGFGAGAGAAAAYGLGMAAVVMSLTVTLAVASKGLVNALRRSLQYVEMVAGAFVLISGLYLLWYFYWVDVREHSEPITDAVNDLQVRLQGVLYDNWQVVAMAMASIVGGALLYSTARERRRPGVSAE
jgi:cytochrome c biogenesis protein CcdA